VKFCDKSTKGKNDDGEDRTYARVFPTDSGGGWHRGGHGHYADCDYKLEGSIAGFEACRGKSPGQLREPLTS
jgi:hypothetical protein